MIIALVSTLEVEATVPSKHWQHYYYYYYYYYLFIYLFTAIGFAPGGSSPTLVQTKTMKQHYTVVQHNTIIRLSVVCFVPVLN
jgi:hypothetical protein